MSCIFGPKLPRLPRKCLPACIAALFAVHSLAASAVEDAIRKPASGNVLPSPGSLRTVDNCDDSGQGSLRDAVANAVSGDVIDLTQLACSEITLFNGKLAVTVSDLTLLGPGSGPDASHRLTIYGWYDRVLEHGAGSLVVSGLTLAYGHYTGVFARGGCISTQGSLVIEDSVISGCEVDAPNGSNAFAAGGAIYSQGELWMRNTVVTNNVAYSATQVAYGGGIFAGSVVTILGSTVANNKVVAPQAYAIGGGLMVVGVDDVSITSSTISGNEAELAGGLRVDTLGSAELVDTTLSGNAALYVGGAHFSNGPVALKNSTVTRNVAYASTAGVFTDQAITIQSSILADNRTVTGYSTFDVYAQAINGASNLITSAHGGTPMNTIALCPRLSALADHGGPTLTHALLPGGPGIDVGNNTVPLGADQRGVSYARVVGNGADIGAYEWQGELDDALFKSAFEIACDEY